MCLTMYNTERSFGKKVLEASRKSAGVAVGVGVGILGVAGGIGLATYELFLTPHPTLAHAAVGLLGYVVLPGIAGKAAKEGGSALYGN